MQALLPLLLLAAAPADDRAIDAAVAVGLKTWKVPGAAVVVVRDGRVVYLKGHGTRTAGKNEPVTADTLFALSSCSKAFTTAAMAQLVAEGKLDWDDPVQKHLPWFRLADPRVEREVALRDLLCHRTGLAGHELLWNRAPWSPEEAVRRLRHLPLAKPFRTTLQYQSTTFAAAGLAAAAADGRSWSEMIEQRLLKPLDLKATLLNDTAAARVADRATPHKIDRSGQTVPIPRYESPYPDPAITIHSTARDLGSWLRFHLAEGEPLVPAKHLRETHASQMVIRLSPAQQYVFMDTNQVTYALGWAVHDYRGVKQVSHGGAIDGIRTHVTFVPDKKLGIAVLTNVDRSPLALTLSNTIVDLQCGYPKRDWNAIHMKLSAALDEGEKKEFGQPFANRRKGTTPSREPGAYVGDYEHPAYGTMQVRLVRGQLVWRWRNEEVPLEHFHFDTFLVSTDVIRIADLTFQFDDAGRVAGLYFTGGIDLTFRRLKGKP